MRLYQSEERYTQGRKEDWGGGDQGWGGGGGMNGRGAGRGRREWEGGRQPVVGVDVLFFFFFYSESSGCGFGGVGRQNKCDYDVALTVRLASTAWRA